MGRVICLLLLSIGAFVNHSHADETGVRWGLIVGDAPAQLVAALREQGGVTAERMLTVPAPKNPDPATRIAQFLSRPKKEDAVFVFVGGRVADIRGISTLLFGPKVFLGLPRLRDLLEGCTAGRITALLDLPAPGCSPWTGERIARFRRSLRGIEVLTACGPDEVSHRDEKEQSVFAVCVAKAIAKAPAPDLAPMDAATLHRSIGWDLMEWALDHGVAQSPGHHPAIPRSVPREAEEVPRESPSPPEPPVVEVEPAPAPPPTPVEEPIPPPVPVEEPEPPVEEAVPPAPEDEPAPPAEKDTPCGLGVVAQDRLDAKGTVLPGAQVLAVHPAAAGRRAGLRDNDVVLAVDGHAFAGAAEFRTLSRRGAKGTKVTLHVRRGRATIDLVAELAPVSPEIELWCDTRRIHLRWGMELLALDARVAYQRKTPVDRGLLLLDVRQGSPAARAGLFAGDVIRRCAGKEPRTLADFPAGVPRISLWVMRGTRVLELELHGE